MRINRSFLIQYLRDICSLHYTISLFEDSIDYQRRLIKELEDSVRVPIPRFENQTESEVYGLLFGIGVVELVCSLGLKGITLIAYVGFINVLANIGLAFGMIFTLYGGCMIWLENSNNKAIEQSNIEKHAQYMLDLDEAKKQIAPQRKEHEEWIAFMQEEKNKVEKILNKAYSANIIPNYYRDMYCAVYLYDWFQSGQSTDIDRALSMYVLEEIKARLDQIILNQQNILLNQRIMIANQYKTMEQINRHAREMEAKMEEIAQSNAERNMYLKMIQANTETTAFFVAADYLQN